MINRQSFAMRERKMPDHLANRQKLVPASLRGAKFAVLEITDAVQVDARRGENKRTGEPVYEPAVALAYKEFPRNIHWLNKMGVNILCDVFGDDESQWVGNKVPVVVQENVTNPTEGGASDMLWIANADEWEKLFAEDEDTRSKSTANAPTARNAAAEAARAAAERRKNAGTATTAPTGGKSKRE